MKVIIEDLDVGQVVQIQLMDVWNLYEDPDPGEEAPQEKPERILKVFKKAAGDA